MHWNVLFFIKPTEGQQCIVGRSREGRRAFIIGTFHEYNSVKYWHTSKGCRVICQENDKWYAMDDMLSSISERLADEIKSSL